MGDYGSSIGVTSDDLIYVSGIMQNNAVFGNITISTNNQYANLFIGQLDSNGTWNWVVTAGGPNSNSDRIRDIAVDSNDNILLTGYFLDSAVFGLHYFPKTSVENNQYRGFIVKLCTDSDGDYYNDCNDHPYLLFLIDCLLLQQ